MSNTKAYIKQYYKDNRKKLLKYEKQYNIDNKKLILERARKHNKINCERMRNKWKEYAHTPKGRFSQYKYNAKVRGFIFKMTFDEFIKIINQPCHYCGGEGYGIDRLDNAIGYLKDNIVSCCSICNRMKNVDTEESFINQCIKISNNWKEGE